MNRKEFLATTMLGAAATRYDFLLGNQRAFPEPYEPFRNTFNLNYAPKISMFKNLAGPELMDQLRFIKETGFSGITDDGMGRRPIEEQKKIGQALERLNLRMGVIGGHKYFWDKPQMVLGDQDVNDSFLSELKSTIEVAKRVNATWLTIMPGMLNLRMESGYQTANVIEILKKASGVLEPHNLVMVLEPVNRNYPGLFLTTISQAYSICKAVDSPSCKILNDLYHQQITEGNLIHNIDKAWDQIGIFQVGDNPGRNEPFTGEINFKNIFRHLHQKGYDGLIGMEHGQSIPGKDGEQAIIDAYLKADNFKD